MATATGKTPVMAMLILWQAANHRNAASNDDRFVRHFLILTPGLTEAGFGSVLGFEKVMHIKARSNGLEPDAGVWVAYLNPMVSALSEQLLYNKAYSDGVIIGSTRAQAYGASERDGSQISIDLKHFAHLLAENLPDTDISPSLSELTKAIDRLVVHSNHDGSRPYSFGVGPRTLYFLSAVHSAVGSTSTTTLERPTTSPSESKL